MFLKCPCDGAVQTGHRGSQCVGMTSGGGGAGMRGRRSPPKVKESRSQTTVGALRVKSPAFQTRRHSLTGCKRKGR